MKKLIIYAAVIATAKFTYAAEPTVVSTNASAPASADAKANNAAPPPVPAEAPITNAPLAEPIVATASSGSAEGGTNMLKLNFRGASLDQVLSYFSEAAGYVINVKPGTSVRGKVDVWSSDPLTREEALNLLDTVLYQNQLAAIRNGKTLTIVNRDEAKTQNVPVIQGGDPERIPMTDKVVTQIIPVRFVEVGQLVKDLQPLVSTQTTMTADDAGNSIVITDTQANIHKVAEIVRAIDMSAEDFTELHVFKLKHADPTETSDLLSNLFPDDSRSGNSQSPFSGGGGGGSFRRMMFGGGFGGGGQSSGGSGSGSNSQSQRIKKRNRVIAVADQRTTSVVVSCSRDLMQQISDVVAELDNDPSGVQTVTVVHPKVADVQQVMQVLQEAFPSTSNNQSRQNSAQQNSPLSSRVTTQTQQNNNNARTSMGGSGSRGGPAGTFGQ
ncbi:MAG TPA: secretin N-terminal domain-containing protein [Candidatus Dormibacteraeota bacterium]|nr:secretin N-terminal domain-containing protein [Candidatus Dormibacteraeota bacterium]